VKLPYTATELDNGKREELAARIKRNTKGSRSNLGEAVV
jgi:hypothetical protein